MRLSCLSLESLTVCFYHLQQPYYYWIMNPRKLVSAVMVLAFCWTAVVLLHRKSDSRVQLPLLGWLAWSLLILCFGCLLIIRRCDRASAAARRLLTRDPPVEEEWSLVYSAAALLGENRRRQVVGHQVPREMRLPSCRALRRRSS